MKSCAACGINWRNMLELFWTLAILPMAAVTVLTMIVARSDLRRLRLAKGVNGLMEMVAAHIWRREALSAFVQLICLLLVIAPAIIPHAPIGRANMPVYLARNALITLAALAIMLKSIMDLRLRARIIRFLGGLEERPND